ncbi:MAG: hypothetical protein N2234_10115 [Planctomycetota bacterium]|nr:hypothetical protein [Planctomycetota bacterium]
MNRREVFPQTTGIGSVPYTDAEKSLDMVLRTVNIPFWTQHPRLSPLELMTHQYSENLPYVSLEEDGRRVYCRDPEEDSYAEMERFYEVALKESYVERLGRISERYARGLYAFLKRLEKTREKFPFIKIHTTGVFTFTLGLNFSNGTPIYSNTQMRQASSILLTAKSLWQVSRFSPYCKRCLLFLDEPILSAIGSYPMLTDSVVVETLAEIISAVKKQSPETLVAIHCCGNTDWSLLIESGLDILSFDAYFYGDALLLYSDSLRRFLHKGGILSFGIVPTDGENTLLETEESLRRRLNQLLERLSSKGVSVPENQILFTPSCGTGSLSPTAAERVFSLLSSFSQ